MAGADAAGSAAGGGTANTADAEGTEKLSVADTKKLVKQLKKDGIVAEMKVTFPRKPETNFGTVKGRTVTVDLLKSMYSTRIGKDGKLVMSCSAE